VHHLNVKGAMFVASLFNSTGPMLRLGTGWVVNDSV
jgi:hypothetical protein